MLLYLTLYQLSACEAHFFLVSLRHRGTGRVVPFLAAMARDRELAGEEILLAWLEKEGRGDLILGPPDKGWCGKRRGPWTPMDAILELRGELISGKRQEEAQLGRGRWCRLLTVTVEAIEPRWSGGGDRGQQPPLCTRAEECEIEARKTANNVVALVFSSFPLALAIGACLLQLPHGPTSSFHFSLQLVLLLPAARTVLCLAEEQGPVWTTSTIARLQWRHCSQPSVARHDGGRGDNNPPALGARARGRDRAREPAPRLPLAKCSTFAHNSRTVVCTCLGPVRFNIFPGRLRWNGLK